MVVLKEMKNMFWALTLESGKRYTQKVEKAFHLSMAALEETNKKQGEGMVSVMISTEKAEFLICSLRHKTHFNQPLDLNFTEEEEITFFVNGDGTVHLSGYQLEDERDDFDDFDDLEDDESEDEAPELVPAKGTKRKSQPAESNAKKMKVATKQKKVQDDDDEDMVDEDDDDDDDDDDVAVESFLDDDVDEEEDDEDLMIDEDDDEDDDEEGEVKLQKKNQVKEKMQAQTPKSEKKKQEKKPQQATPVSEKKQPQTPSSSVTPSGDASESAKKKKKKKKNKKNKNEETPDKPQQQQQQQQQQQKQDGQGQSKTPKKQVLQGGLVMEEHKTGNGPVAKAGKMIQVYYVGKLQKDGKQFDSCTSGKPFKFRLGSKEVISGWDKGLEGMKVGGKRRLIVPPKEAYGNQRQGPIPPNSTLIFDIELKSVS